MSEEGGAARQDEKRNVSGFPVQRVASLGALLKVVRRDTSDWPSRWFRGNYGDFSLLPKALRENAPVREELHAFFQFRNGALTLFDRYTEDDLKTLVLAQHYGVRTRLLDWSQSLSVAIYFALDVYEQATDQGARAAEKDIFIWALDPGFLNRLTREDWGQYGPAPRAEMLRMLREQTRQDEWDAVTGSDDRPRAYAELARTSPDEWPKRDQRGSRDYPMELPLAMFPAALDKRIMLQRSGFTMHGRNSAPLEQQVAEIAGPGDATPLRGYCVPADSLEEFEADFRLIGPTSTLVYGDPQGLALDIGRQSGQRRRAALRRG